MIPLRRVLAAAAAAFALSAQAPVPELRVEATDAGSILRVANRATQPLTAFLIELVDYPGSSFSYAFDDLAAPVAPGTEKRIQVTNMLPGAVPDYVKLQAAVFADGSTAGAAANVARLVDRRRATLEATREAIRRIGSGERAPELRQWADSLRGAANVPRREVAESAIRRIERGSVEDALAELRKSEALLGASRPAL